MKEVGAYIRTLRKEQGLTQQALAVAAGVHHNYIWRVETGKTARPSNHHVSALIHALNGSMDKVAELLADGTEAEDVGHRAAKNLSAQIAPLPEEEQATRRRQVIKITDELLTDPKRLDRWIGYGERLRDEPLDR